MAVGRARWDSRMNEARLAELIGSLSLATDVAVVGRDERDRRIAKIEQIGSRGRAAVRAMTALVGLSGRRALQRIGRNYGHGDTDHYWQLVEAQLEYRRRFAAALDAESIDLIVSPACALP